MVADDMLRRPFRAWVGLVCRGCAGTLERLLRQSARRLMLTRFVHEWRCESLVGERRRCVHRAFARTCLRAWRGLVGQLSALRSALDVRGPGCDLGAAQRALALPRLALLLRAALLAWHRLAARHLARGLAAAGPQHLGRVLRDILAVCFVGWAGASAIRRTLRRLRRRQCRWLRRWALLWRLGAYFGCWRSAAVSSSSAVAARSEAHASALDASRSLVRSWNAWRAGSGSLRTCLRPSRRDGALRSGESWSPGSAAVVLSKGFCAWRGAVSQGRLRSRFLTARCFAAWKFLAPISASTSRVAQHAVAACVASSALLTTAWVWRAWSACATPPARAADDVLDPRTSTSTPRRDVAAASARSHDPAEEPIALGMTEEAALPAAAGVQGRLLLLAVSWHAWRIAVALRIADQLDVWRREEERDHSIRPAPVLQLTPRTSETYLLVKLFMSWRAVAACRGAPLAEQGSMCVASAVSMSIVARLSAALFGSCFASWRHVSLVQRLRRQLLASRRLRPLRAYLWAWAHAALSRRASLARAHGGATPHLAWRAWALHARGCASRRRTAEALWWRSRALDGRGRARLRLCVRAWRGSTLRFLEQSCSLMAQASQGGALGFTAVAFAFVLWRLYVLVHGRASDSDSDDSASTASGFDVLLARPSSPITRRFAAEGRGPAESCCAAASPAPPSPEAESPRGLPWPPQHTLSGGTAAEAEACSALPHGPRSLGALARAALSLGAEAPAAAPARPTPWDAPPAAAAWEAPGGSPGRARRASPSFPRSFAAEPVASEPCAAYGAPAASLVASASRRAPGSPPAPRGAERRDGAESSTSPPRGRRCAWHGSGLAERGLYYECKLCRWPAAPQPLEPPPQQPAQPPQFLPQPSLTPPPSSRSSPSGFVPTAPVSQRAPSRPARGGVCASRRSPSAASPRPLRKSSCAGPRPRARTPPASDSERAPRPPFGSSSARGGAAREPCASRAATASEAATPQSSPGDRERFCAEGVDAWRPRYRPLVMPRALSPRCARGAWGGAVVPPTH